MMDWLHRRHRKRRDAQDAGRWVIWMYQSSKEGYSAPLLLFVYEWERTGYRAPWVQTVYSSDEEPDWAGGDPSDPSDPDFDTFEQAYWFTELITKGEARRVGPVPFEMSPPRRGRGELATSSSATQQPTPAAD
jgi:hypothetical protein